MVLKSGHFGQGEPVMNRVHTRGKAAVNSGRMGKLRGDGPRGPPAMDRQGSPEGCSQADGLKSSWFFVWAQKGCRAAILG